MRVVTPSSHAAIGSGIGLQVFRGGDRGVLTLVLDAFHDGVFHLGAEDELAEQLAGIGALLGVAAPGQRVDRGAAVVGAEILVAAAQVRDVELLVHRVRLPGQEDDPVLAAGTCG